MPGLRSRCPVGGVRESRSMYLLHICVFLPLFLPPYLLSKTKQIKNLHQKQKRGRETSACERYIDRLPLARSGPALYSDSAHGTLTCERLGSFSVQLERGWAGLSGPAVGLGFLLIVKVPGEGSHLPCQPTPQGGGGAQPGGLQNQGASLSRG